MATDILSTDFIQLRDLHPGDAGWVVQRHGELYWVDEGYDIRFEGLVAGILANFIKERGPKDRAWIAVDGQGTRQGCVFCVWPDDATAKLRMFLVEPAMRGSGWRRGCWTQWWTARGWAARQSWSSGLMKATGRPAGSMHATALNCSMKSRSRPSVNPRRNRIGR
jgi:hypothetical protein